MASEVTHFEADVEATRDRIAATVDDLQHRLSPRTLVNGALEGIGARGADMMTSVQKVARGNPVGFTAVGLAIGLSALGLSKLQSRSTMPIAGSESSLSKRLVRAEIPRRSSNLGAVAIGAGLGLALALGRKLMVQAVSGASGDWMAALKIEHKLAAGIMDKMAETENTETVKRNILLATLKHALGKHAFQEENVIYPALREVHEEAEADELNDEHGYIKTYLYRLEMTPKDAPEWLDILADFRALLEKHVREEEDVIYPPFHQKMTAEQNRKLTLTMNKEGFKLA